ncbi:RagB/SusD family nutrient uptake outer membrane protein [Sabulilitoribacter arenilitoris]|uniref:RagB/SusD family nutrient uptake outer membrane protein n=1 Tax=Wocania arenilitoris TaxID=2044858 RepID=A0AAE3JKX2_9FLAO|nr:RagB/SusD family nutrient uptake outer membrane protein [Wocania arenilitoris]MCF7567639.1 RagB/SusD family nutrient uptake outer membrane protein [Wocania arenilitoris]
MKNLKYILIILLSGILFTACNEEDFLDKTPKDELSAATIFSTYNNIKTYSWSFYDFLESYGRSTSWAATRDLDGDLMQTNGRRSYLYASYNIPNSDGRYSSSYSNIRKVNIMLDHLDESNITEEEKNHWRGVGLFFRAHEYFTLLSTFGGVTWVENELTDLDTDLLYAPRDSRDLVADNILRDLLFAVDNIKENGDGDNTITADVARALLSRFGLFEGTWRKYHGLASSEKFLNACITASQELVNKHPSIMSNYDHVFNSENLAGQPGILLYKHYIIDELTHWVSTDTRSTNNKYDITRKGIDKFLTKNGMPIYNAGNTQYLGDKNFNDEFKNRDNRLLIMTPPPYKVTGDGGQEFDFLSTDLNDPTREYFSILESITSGFPYKNLPDRNWSGRVTGEVPNFTKLVPTQTNNGYRFWKVWNEHNYKVSSADVSDCPIFRMGEVMLNYAEAAFEMGQFNQAIADATITKLRARGGVDPMDVGAITADWDPMRDQSVDPVLWEIRRERAIELMGDGYRRDDLRRWKKMDYATEIKLGRWVSKSDYPTVKIQNNASEGYIQAIDDIPPAFPEYYYLYPIPSNERVINPNLDQNPDW